MTTDLRECEEAARAHGLAKGLDRALDGVDVRLAAPGPYAAVPAGRAGGADVHRHRLAELEGVVFVRRDQDGPHDAEACARVGRRLAHTRLGLARRLLDQATVHLSARTGGGEPLSRKQMVIGTVADVMSGIELLRHYARSQDSRRALVDLHHRLDVLGWEIARLFGAAGYIADNEVRALHVSALAANTWIDGELSDDRV
ncbi:acyl-CoA dehydrogenase [Streptomyces sp. NPDC006482]|uniref:acyl-CoA dehydrogenase n=1 Tax=unclassified Streptomyces TaxID=2593676 RepID=UPI00225588FE|nr:acyl-CoA dehydrogenase [Streptomyces sp. NBC_00094]MCX5391927.1 acyl-CoA dehydrogenase [Streptomyces sp. NBC_00094]